MACWVFASLETVFVEASCSYTWHLKCSFKGLAIAFQWGWRGAHAATSSSIPSSPIPPPWPDCACHSEEAEAWGHCQAMGCFGVWCNPSNDPHHWSRSTASPGPSAIGCVGRWAAQPHGPALWWATWPWPLQDTDSHHCAWTSKYLMEVPLLLKSWWRAVIICAPIITTILVKTSWTAISVAACMCGSTCCLPCTDEFY